MRWILLRIMPHVQDRSLDPCREFLPSSYLHLPFQMGLQYSFLISCFFYNIPVIYQVYCLVILALHYGIPGLFSPCCKESLPLPQPPTSSFLTPLLWAWITGCSPSAHHSATESPLNYKPLPPFLCWVDCGVGEWVGGVRGGCGG